MPGLGRGVRRTIFCLAIGSAACATPQTFARRARFQAARPLLYETVRRVLEERGEELLSADRNRWLLVTKPKDWHIDDELVLHYRLSISVQEREIVVYAQGDKRSKSGKIIMADDQDPHLVGISGEIFAAAAAKLGEQAQ